MTDQQPQRYTLTMTTVDGWGELIGTQFSSRQQAEAHGSWLQASLGKIYTGYEVRPTLDAGQPIA